MSESALELEVSGVATGGAMIARHDGRVIFVRNAIPGETVEAVLSQNDDGASFWRADTRAVVRASEDRRTHVWPLADSLARLPRHEFPVGGAEYGHIALERQRTLKAQVFIDLVNRLAKTGPGEPPVIDASALEQVVALELPGEDPLGLGWRTRARFDLDEAGFATMHPFHSGEHLRVDHFPLAVPAINDAGVLEGPLDMGQVPFAQLEIVASGSGELSVLGYSLAGQPRNKRGRGSGRAGTARGGRGRGAPSRSGSAPKLGAPHVLAGPAVVHEPIVPFPGAQPRLLEVAAEGFWQVHRLSPQFLVDLLGRFLDVQPDMHVADLYAGAGLFTAALSARVGPKGSVLSVEGSPLTSANAQRNFEHDPHVLVQNSDVAQALAARSTPLDAVVLDPPRAGAGRDVVEQLCRLVTGEVLYVSCDPASYARDLGYFASHGWRPTQLALLDMYPNTHHMESATLLKKAPNGTETAGQHTAVVTE